MSLLQSARKRKMHENADNDEAEKTFPAKNPESNETIIYIHPDGIGPKRLDAMKHSVSKNGFHLSDTIT